MSSIQHANPSNMIVGCETLSLSSKEQALFAKMRPLGLILFARNIQSPAQLKALVDQFKTIVDNPKALLLIDQEGGRVSRLPHEHWRVPPSPTVFAKHYLHSPEIACKAMKINYQLIAYDLKSCGVNVNCAPMLDVPQDDATIIMHERALGNSPEQVIALAKATIEGLQAGGVEPVIKHAPGHGRGKTDSHKALPVVETGIDELEQWDFVPFKALNHTSMLMTAHIRFTSIDTQRPGTLSKVLINDIIRRKIGFKGLIMTDDIDMHALSGSVAEKATQALSAGCDVVLQCSGNIDDLQALEGVASPLVGDALKRAQHAMNCAAKAGDSIDKKALLNELKALITDVEHTL